MKTIQDTINDQIKMNEGMNIFFEEIDSFHLSPKWNMLSGHFNKLDDSQVDTLLNYSVSRVLNEFYRVNQYYNFSEDAISELKHIYQDLYQELKMTSHFPPERIKNHCQNLREWLEKSNAFAVKVYSSQDRFLDQTPCFEYTPVLQMDILQLNLSGIIEPVLDIGCGENAHLVQYLRSEGINAFGIDRYNSDHSYIENTNWLEYDFGNKKWGTIISNLGFSNHFMHHHLREDGEYITYAKKYMEILNSLAVNGSFHYAPDLPFIEEYLSADSYRINKKELEQDYRSSVITRLK